MGFWSCPYWFLLVLSLAISLVDSLTTLKPSCLDDERSALIQLKHNFNIDCDVSDPEYAHPTTFSWADVTEDCCLWEGVKCSNETGHVIGLHLSSSCLYGTFTSNTTLFNLPHLKELDLSDNNFNNSPIPSGFGHKLGKLTSLDLSSSAFSGEIPSDISKLSDLSLLYLYDNSELQLKAFSLERLVQNMTHLNELILDKVDLSSSVPNVFANLTSLRIFSLEKCNLYGEFPTRIFHLPHLQELYVTGNYDLTGVLPKFDHSSLKILNLPYTSFSGELPFSIGKLAHLEVLDILGCGFSGHVPSSLGNLTKLNDLQISDNDFSGDIPSSFANLTQLQYLTISDLNATSDKLFAWLSNLNKLYVLHLNRMNLTEIPSFLANFTSLERLNLDQNHLKDHIPQWLMMSLTQLEELSLSKNQLKGQIPPTISHLKHLEALYLDGNYKLEANFGTLLKLRYLKQLDLSHLKLTFDVNITANVSVSKFTSLNLISCNLTEFPSFLHTQDELQSLNLNDNIIQGFIPLWFVNVTRDNLLELDLSRNFLTGFEKPTEFLPWVNLEILYLDGNKIHGSLPIPSISMLIYQLSNNSFTGEISQDICQARLIDYLDLSFNNLFGLIPECIVDLGGSLQILNLQGNNFNGTIPHVYSRSCKFKMINLSNNQLTGNLPRFLENCRDLEVLDIGSNQINDTFPSWLGILPKLHILVLRHNHFHGRIERQNDAFSFHSLRILDLSNNFHSGSLPSDYLEKWDAMKVGSEAHSTTLGTMVNIMVRTSPQYLFLGEVYNYTMTIESKGNDMPYTKILNVLRIIDFSSNNFTGPIPYLIGELKGLQAINLSNNNIEGGIPSSLANIRDLESLDLSNNKLSGEIPQQLAQLIFLEVFNVSQNLLVGPIPQGNQFGTFDNSSFDGNLGLCGDTLSKRCGNAYSPPPPALAKEDKKDGNSAVIDWVIRSLGCVSGFVIGCVIGKYMTDKHHHWFVDTFGRKKRTRTKSRRRS